MSKLKILIVDDEQDYCQILKSYFPDKRYEVITAFTLKEGLALLETIQPHFLLLDNNLPDGQGWKCVDKIVEKNPQLKIYLISAYKHKSDFSSNSPNITVWEKPISMSTLSSVFG